MCVIWQINDWLIEQYFSLFGVYFAVEIVCIRVGETTPWAIQVWFKILFYCIPQLIYESKSERIIEIGPHLPKLS